MVLILKYLKYFILKDLKYMLVSLSKCMGFYLNDSKHILKMKLARKLKTLIYRNP